MPIDEEQRLQAEWREIIRNELAEIKSANRELQSAVASLNSTIASYQIEHIRKTHDDHEDRIRSLETFAWRMVGSMFAVNGMLGAGLVLLNLWLDKKP